MTLFRSTVFILTVILLTGCIGKKTDTKPSTRPVLDVPKLDIPPDPGMYKALRVVKRFGEKIIPHLTFTEFKKQESAGRNAAFNPDVFYDRYILDMNEKNYWVTLTLRTSARSKQTDSRIRELMEKFSENVIDVILKTPAEKTFLLSDSNADGVLDFAAPEGRKPDQRLTVDIELLRIMQQKYGWILGIIKRHYK